MKKIFLPLIGAMITIITTFSLSQSILVAATMYNENICTDTFGNGDYVYDATQRELAGCNETRTVQNSAKNIISTILQITGVIAVVVIVYGGYLILSAAGSPDKVTKGKKTILWAVVGLVISVSAFIIINFVLEKVF